MSCTSTSNNSTADSFQKTTGLKKNSVSFGELPTANQFQELITLISEKLNALHSHLMSFRLEVYENTKLNLEIKEAVCINYVKKEEAIEQMQKILGGLSDSLNNDLKFLPKDETNIR